MRMCGFSRCITIIQDNLPYLTGNGCTAQCPDAVSGRVSIGNYRTIFTVSYRSNTISHPEGAIEVNYDQGAIV